MSSPASPPPPPPPPPPPSTPPASPAPPQEPGLISRSPVDAQHVKVLAVLYFVMSGLALFGMCFGGVYIMLGLALQSDAVMASGNATPAEVQEMQLGGTIMGIAGGVALFISVVAGAMHLLTGFFLLRHTHRTFCVVVAAITCLSIPIGTVLGVFTIVVLARPAVRVMFDADRSEPLYG
ncbi:MAG: hypothetical protein KJO43_03810 [Phycisphaerae bacterium]|nr:hypothetical protein [Phycisphaerae bacterium]